MRRKGRRRFRFSFERLSFIAAVIGLFTFGFFYFSNTQNNGCANSISCIKDLAGEYEENGLEGEFLGRKVFVPPFLSTESFRSTVLGENSSASKKIYIDLTNQMLYAYEDGKVVYNFLISSGKWGKTPTGDFRIWIKLRYTRMTGGSKERHTYYNLPNVPYTMYFYSNEIPKSRGYGVHGAYWHNNFGHPMSHGCINMRVEDSEKLYNWALPQSTSNTTYASDENPGTPITIYGTAPLE